MIAEANGEGGGGEHGVGKARGAENRRRGDEEIVHGMHAGVAVHDAPLRVVGHARGTDVVAADTAFIANDSCGFGVWEFDFTRAGAGEFLREDAVAFADAVAVQFGGFPLHFHAPEAELVELVAEHDPAVGVWRLFRVEVQRVAVRFAAQRDGRILASGQCPFEKPVQAKTNKPR